MHYDFEKYSTIAHEATQKAADFLRGHYGTVKEMIHKAGTHYGIADDLTVNGIIEEYLQEKTPEVMLYSEEGKRHLTSQLVWVIDPIDGTSNYRVGVPLFVTQVCLLYNNEPVVGIINAPLLDLIFSVQKGKGAYLNGTRIHVSDTSQMHKAMVGFNKGFDISNVGQYIATLGSIVRTIRIYGSMGIDLAYLASGKLDVLINSGSDLYDYAPGVLLVREAGGVAVNFHGDDWTFKDKTLIATNTKLIKEVVTSLHEK